MPVLTVMQVSTVFIYCDCPMLAMIPASVWSDGRFYSDASVYSVYLLWLSCISNDSHAVLSVIPVHDECFTVIAMLTVIVEMLVFQVRECLEWCHC